MQNLKFEEVAPGLMWLCLTAAEDIGQAAGVVAHLNLGRLPWLALVVDSPPSLCEWLQEHLQARAPDGIGVVVLPSFEWWAHW